MYAQDISKAINNTDQGRISNLLEFFLIYSSRNSSAETKKKLSSDYRNKYDQIVANSLKYDPNTFKISPNKFAKSFLNLFKMATRKEIEKKGKKERYFLISKWQLQETLLLIIHTSPLRR